MSLAKQVARVVNKIAPCTWVEVQSEMPEYSEMQIRRALMNATAQGYVLVEAATRAIPGQRHRPVGVYRPNPLWFQPAPPKSPRPTSAPRPAKPVKTPVFLLDVEQDDEDEPALTPDMVVMLAMANRHPLEGWLTA